MVRERDRAPRSAADLNVRPREVTPDIPPLDVPITPREPESDIVYQPPAPAHDSASYEPPLQAPAGMITGRDSDALSAFERTRSAVWPLVLALVVGIAIGFAGGFFAGSRELSPAPPAVAAPTAAAAPVPGAKEFTEAAVPAAPASAGNSELKTQKSEHRSQN